MYDSALGALVLVRAGQRERAAGVLLGLAALQGPDGSLPFSLTLPSPDPTDRYERSGAIAWAGYAAAEYLDADPGGPARDEVLRFAHRAASYLLARQVHAPGDRRDGLVLGGRGTLRYAIVEGVMRETVQPGDVTWASVEHNVDAFFFLRLLGRVTDTTGYGEAAERVAAGLMAHAWDERAGQFVEGIDQGSVDEVPALDCASWGSLFLVAANDGDRAGRAVTSADTRYASRDEATGASGHRPYASGPVFAEASLANYFVRKGEWSTDKRSWETLGLVWPEGSAGVALAAWRTGHPDRARAILSSLESLRSADGSLPTSTMEVPFELDREPSVAGTAWVELVRFDLDRAVERQTLWAP